MAVKTFYGLELVFKVSFRVRTRFRIRINNVISVIIIIHYHNWRTINSVL